MNKTTDTLSNLGTAKIIPYDGESALICADYLKTINKYLQNEGEVNSALYTQPRYLSVGGEPIRVEGVSSVPRNSVVIPREKYSDMGYKGEYTADVFVSIIEQDV